jgi:hypothetical protein
MRQFISEIDTVSQLAGIPLRICGKRGKTQALCFQTFKLQEKNHSEAKSCKIDFSV